MSNVMFDYKNRVWLASDGNFIVNGCKYCGLAQRGHAWYSFCASFEGSNGHYSAPDDALILLRMKANRQKRNQQ